MWDEPLTALQGPCSASIIRDRLVQLVAQLREAEHAPEGIHARSATSRAAISAIGKCGATCYDLIRADPAMGGRASLALLRSLLRVLTGGFFPDVKPAVAAIYRSVEQLHLCFQFSGCAGDSTRSECGTVEKDDRTVQLTHGGRCSGVQPEMHAVTAVVIDEYLQRCIIDTEVNPTSVVRVLAAAASMERLAGLPQACGAFLETITAEKAIRYICRALRSLLHPVSTATAWTGVNATSGNECQFTKDFDDSELIPRTSCGTSTGPSTLGIRSRELLRALISVVTAHRTHSAKSVSLSIALQTTSVPIRASIQDDSPECKLRLTNTAESSDQGVLQDMIDMVKLCLCNSALHQDALTAAAMLYCTLLRWMCEGSQAACGVIHSLYTNMVCWPGDDTVSSSNSIFRLGTDHASFDGSVDAKVEPQHAFVVVSSLACIHAVLSQCATEELLVPVQSQQAGDAGHAFSHCDSTLGSTLLYLCLSRILRHAATSAGNSTNVISYSLMVLEKWIIRGKDCMLSNITRFEPSSWMQLMLCVKQHLHQCWAQVAKHDVSCLQVTYTALLDFQDGYSSEATQDRQTAMTCDILQLLDSCEQRSTDPLRPLTRTEHLLNSVPSTGVIGVLAAVAVLVPRCNLPALLSARPELLLNLLSYARDRMLASSACLTALIITQQAYSASAACVAVRHVSSIRQLWIPAVATCLSHSSRDLRKAVLANYLAPLLRDTEKQRAEALMELSEALLSSTTAAGIDDNMPGRDDDTHRYHGMIALLGLAYKQGIPLELSFRHSGNASPLTSSTVSNGSPTASAVILHCLLAADDDLRCDTMQLVGEVLQCKRLNSSTASSIQAGWCTRMNDAVDCLRAALPVLMKFETARSLQHSCDLLYECYVASARLLSDLPKRSRGAVAPRSRGQVVKQTDARTCIQTPTLVPTATPDAVLSANPNVISQSVPVPANDSGKIPALKQSLHAFQTEFRHLLRASLYPGASQDRLLGALQLILLHSTNECVTSPNSFSGASSTPALLHPDSFSSCPIITAEDVPVLLVHMRHDWDRVRHCAFKVVRDVVLRPLPCFQDVTSASYLLGLGWKWSQKPGDRDCDFGVLLLRSVLHEMTHHHSSRVDVALLAVQATFDFAPVVTLSQPAVIARSIDCETSFLQTLSSLLQYAQNVETSLRLCPLETRYDVSRHPEHYIHGLVRLLRTTLREKSTRLLFDRSTRHDAWKDVLRQCLRSMLALLDVCLESLAMVVEPSRDHTAPNPTVNIDARGHVYVLTADADDGFEDGLDNADEDTLLCTSNELSAGSNPSWLCCKELCLLLSWWSELLEWTSRDVSLVLHEDVCEIYRRFSSIFSSVKHLGILDTARDACSLFCRTLCRQDSHARKHSIPSSWVPLVTAWRVDLLDTIGRPGQSNAWLRRSAGLAQHVIALLTAHRSPPSASTEPGEASESFLRPATSREPNSDGVIPSTVARLLSLFQDPTSENSSWESVVVTMNVARAICRNGSLWPEASSFAEDCLVAAIKGFSSPRWTVRNSSLMLFTTLLKRLLHTEVRLHASTARISEWSQYGQAMDRGRWQHESLTASLRACSHGINWPQLKLRYPRLTNLLVCQLSSSCGALASTSAAVGVLHSMYPLLLLLSHLAPVSHQSYHLVTDGTLSCAQLSNLLLQCMASPDYMVRVMAANACCAMIPHEQSTVSVELKRLVDLIQDKCSQKSIDKVGPREANELHGYLLVVLRLLGRIRSSFPPSHAVPSHDRSLLALDGMVASFFLNDPGLQGVHPIVAEVYVRCLAACAEWTPRAASKDRLDVVCDSLLATDLRSHREPGFRALYCLALQERMDRIVSEVFTGKNSPTDNGACGHLEWLHRQLNEASRMGSIVLQAFHHALTEGRYSKLQPASIKSSDRSALRCIVAALIDTLEQHSGQQIGPLCLGQALHVVLALLSRAVDFDRDHLAALQDICLHIVSSKLEHLDLATTALQVLSYVLNARGCCKDGVPANWDQWCDALMTLSRDDHYPHVRYATVACIKASGILARASEALTPIDTGPVEREWLQAHASVILRCLWILVCRLNDEHETIRQFAVEVFCSERGSLKLCHFSPSDQAVLLVSRHSARVLLTEAHGTSGMPALSGSATMFSACSFASSVASTANIIQEYVSLFITGSQDRPYVLPAESAKCLCQTDPEPGNLFAEPVWCSEVASLCLPFAHTAVTFPVQIIERIQISEADHLPPALMQRSLESLDPVIRNRAEAALSKLQGSDDTAVSQVAHIHCVSANILSVWRLMCLTRRRHTVADPNGLGTEQMDLRTLFGRPLSIFFRISQIDYELAGESQVC